jgi:hypothetical protein
MDRVAPPGFLVVEDSASIFVLKCHAVPMLCVQTATVNVLQATLEIRKLDVPQNRAAVTIWTVPHKRFASTLRLVYESVLMDANGFSVDLMHFVSLKVTDQRAFVKKDSLETLWIWPADVLLMLTMMVLLMVAHQTRIVPQNMFVRLISTESTSVSNHAQPLVVHLPMNAAFQKIAALNVSVWMDTSATLSLHHVSNRYSLTAVLITIVLQVMLANPMD